MTTRILWFVCAAAAVPACSGVGPASDAGGTNDARADIVSSGDATSDIVSVDASSDAMVPEAAPGDTACPAPVSAAPTVDLADFESGTIPDSETTATEGFRSADVANGTIIHPGANGTSAAAAFDFGTSNAIFFQGNMRPQYLNGSATYNPDLANAIEFYIRVPSGSGLLATSGTTFGLWTYELAPGDPWVGTNSSGGNLTDSQMHGYGNVRFSPAAADQWVHVVMSSSAFAQSRGNYHFYAARAVVQDDTVFGVLRQFELVSLVTLTGAGATLDFDELRLITLPPTASVCPAYAAQTVSASGGDVRIPVTIANPTSTARMYRAFLSSEIGLDRQTLEGAMHDTDSVQAVDDLQGGVGADGSVGAVELFAADATGAPTGSSILPSGSAISVAAGAHWQGVLVHHVTAAMLGSVTSVTTGCRSYSLARNTLTTSLIVWDPNEPPHGDAACVFGGSNADSSHPAPPGFPAYLDPPTGWHSTDVPIDQPGGYFVSVLQLTP